MNAIHFNSTVRGPFHPLKMVPAVILAILLFPGYPVRAAYRVRQGTTTLTSTSQAQSISAVNSISRAFVVIHYYYGSDGTGNVEYNADVGMASAYLEDTTTIRFNRGSSSDDVTVSWTVIEALDEEFEVFRGSQARSGTATLYTPSIGATVTGDTCFA